MIESTLQEDIPEEREWYIVYDARNGSVVHIHEFIGGGEYESSKDTPSREEFAMSLAERLCDRKHLRVMPAPSDFVLSPGATVAVNLDSGALEVEEEESFSLRELREQKLLERDKGTGSV